MIDLDAQIKSAMKARDAVGLNAYRSLKAKVLLKLTEAGRAEGKGLADDEFAALVRKEVKERAESNEFLKPDQPKFQENAGIIAVLEQLLPKTLGGAELDALVRQAIAGSGAQGAKDMGKVMAALKASGAALDMGAASARVKALLEAKA
jgi:hypothetical protein